METGPSAPVQAADKQRIETLLPQIARDYPRVFGPLLALERSLDPSQREATMKYVGNRVEAWVYKRDFARGARQPLAGSIAFVAQPALKQLMAVRLEGDALTTTASPFATLDNGSGVPRCHFVRGFLQGVLNESGHLAPVRVVETQCRCRGASACRFEFQA